MTTAFLSIAATALAIEAFAAADVQITDRLTWDVVGLDSNDETGSGPDTFAVGYRACNEGDQVATNVESAFSWDSANPYIDLAPGVSQIINIGQLEPAACYDLYYNIAIARDDAARQTARRYTIEVSSSGLPTVSTPIDAGSYNEIYVENLISQNRNSINAITGPNVVYQGQTYTFVLDGSTATQGYEQLESFINFPSNIFRVISVQSEYSAPVDPTIDDRFYSDSCGWEHDPESPDYFTNGTNNACATNDKAGGDIVLTYQIEIVGTGNATVTGLIYDFSGSSFHYNTDYGRDILSVEARGLPSLTLSDASQAEGNSGTSQMSFSVTLSEPKTEAISLDYATSNGTASSGTDYTASTGTITIPANSTGTTINIPVGGDTDVEPDEQFTLTIVSADGATISDGVATGTILNDDSPTTLPVTLTIGDAAITEGGNLLFPVSFDNPVATSTSITFQPTNGTASASDYDTSNVQITVDAGQTAAAVTIPTTADLIDEADETITLSVLSIDAGTVDNYADSGTGRILDDDAAPTLTIEDASIAEGGILSFPISLSNPSALDTVITFEATNGTASDDDYTTDDIQITLSAGQTSGTVNIPTTADTLDESDEYLMISVKNIDSGALGDASDTAIGTIFDAPVVSGPTPGATPIPAMNTWFLMVLTGMISLVACGRFKTRA